MKSRLLVPFVAALSLGGVAASAKTVEVNIENMKFDPPAVTVAAGDSVVWINKDIVPHTVTAGRSFDSQMINAGARWSFKAKKKGHFDYKCLFHPQMLGSLEVQ